MKLEIDLEKLARQVQFRKQAEAQANEGTTVQVRQWGELITAFPMIPDEVLEQHMTKIIEGKMHELMMYAPDVSDLKPDEVRIHFDGIMKQARGSFYYVSQIADYWQGKIDRAREDGKYEGGREMMWTLYERWDEESEYGKKRNWQAKAAKDMRARLNLEEDEDE